MGKDRPRVLTPESATGIQDPAERAFAIAATSKDGLRVEYQVQVGTSVIDFRVTNNKGTGLPKLVEITRILRDKLCLFPQKSKQKSNMEASGLPHTILPGESVDCLIRANKKRRKHTS